jgi:hypothetical protein
LERLQASDAGDDEMKTTIDMKCKCRPDSLFHWRQNPRPSMFVKDIYFRPKGKQVYENLTKEENIIAYKQFSIHSRAHPKVKPSKNKHEL